jgi:hypothetical protein
LFQTDSTLPSVVVATFTDITREHNLLADEKRHTRQMKLLNEIINTALETSDFEHMLQIFADRLGEMPIDASSLLRCTGMSSPCSPPQISNQARQH